MSRHFCREGEHFTPLTLKHNRATCKITISVCALAGIVNLYFHVISTFHFSMLSVYFARAPSLKTFLYTSSSLSPTCSHAFFLSSFRTRTYTFGRPVCWFFFSRHWLNHVKTSPTLLEIYRSHKTLLPARKPYTAVNNSSSTYCNYVPSRTRQIRFPDDRKGFISSNNWAIIVFICR